MEKKFFWSLYSKFYDYLLYLKPYKSLITNIATVLQPKDNEVVIDLGSGTGNLEKLYDCEKYRWICLEGNSSMTGIAKNKHIHSKFIEYNLNDYKIPLDDKSVDWAVSSNSLYVVSDLGLFIEDLSRVMRRGGKVVITNSIKDGLWPIIKEHFLESTPIEMFRSIIFSPIMIVILILNIYINNKYDSYFYEEDILTESLKKNGFVVKVEKYLFGKLNVLIVAQKK